jgi:hypothetical protein
MNRHERRAYAKRLKVTARGLAADLSAELLETGGPGAVATTTLSPDGESLTMFVSLDPDLTEFLLRSLDFGFAVEDADEDDSDPDTWDDPEGEG